MVMVMGQHGHRHGHLLQHLPSFGGGRAKQQQQQQEELPVPVPPKGCMAIQVGEEGEEQQRFVVPVGYLTHPLFLGLLKEAEEVYGFDHKGAISIPCQVDHFRKVQALIQKHHHHHHHHFHLTTCFGGGLKA